MYIISNLSLPAGSSKYGTPGIKFSLGISPGRGADGAPPGVALGGCREESEGGAGKPGGGLLKSTMGGT